MEELEELPDITRITARLLLKLEEGGLDQSEPLPFSLGERSFESLLSHAEKIDDEDLCARQVFDSLTKLMSSATGSWSHFKQIYGKLIINSFEISDEDDDRLGWALYLAPSILDHSCVPSAEVNFRGKNIVVKSKVTMRPKDLSKMTVSFIDRTKPFSERQESLLVQFNIECWCEACTEFKLLGERIMSEVRGQPGGPSSSVMKTVEQEAAGKQRHYFRSVRYGEKPVSMLQQSLELLSGAPSVQAGRSRLVISLSLPSAGIVTNKLMEKLWTNISRLKEKSSKVLETSRKRPSLP